MENIIFISLQFFVADFLRLRLYLWNSFHEAL